MNKIVLIISSVIFCILCMSVATSKLNLFPTANAATKDPLKGVKEDNKGIHSVPIEIVLPEMNITSSDKYDDDDEDTDEDTEEEN